MGCAGALAWVLASLYLADVPPEPSSDDYQRSDSLNEFASGETGGRLRLSYGFVDYQGRRQRVSCTISKQDYDRDVASFGYFEDEMVRTINARLRERIEQKGQALGVLTYFDIEVYDRAAYKWRWRTPAGLDPDLQSRVESFDRWLKGELAREKEEMIARYLQERGLQLKGDTIAIDYQRAVLRDTGPLADCFQALREAGSGDSERRRLGLFLAFFQELRYELPPEVDGGRHTLGFRVPSAVLARGAGDCDSKAAAFCTLWRHFPQRVILILVPQHALVGVEGKPRADEAYVRLGNRYFVLCEVAGPAKIPPGGHAISGSFEYVLIEPVG